MDIFNDLKTFTCENNDDHEPLGNVGPCFKGWQKGEMTIEHRQKLSKAASKRKLSKDHLDKLNNGRRNSKNSIEHAANVRQSRLGTKHSEESKQKMSDTKKGKMTTRIAASNGGKACAAKRASDPSYRRAMSEKMKQIWAERKGGLVNGN